MPNQVDVVIALQAQQALASLQGFVGRFQSLIAGLTGGVGIAAMVKQGVEFNSLLEDAGEALGAILLQFQGDKFTSFESAIGRARGLVQELQVAATQTKGSLADLVDAYSGLSPVMFSSNVPLEKQVQLMLMLSNAVNVVARGPNARLQLLQEGRALLTGQFGPDAALARMLFPKETDKEAYKAAIAAGTALDILTKKLKPFAEMGKRAADTFSGRFSNLGDAFQQILGGATVKAFETLKGFFDAMGDAISGEPFKAGLTSLMSLVAKVIEAGGNTAVFGVTHGGSIVKLFEGLAIMFGPLYLLGKLQKLSGGFAALTALFGKLEIALTGMLVPFGLLGTAGAAGVAGVGGWMVGTALGEMLGTEDWYLKAGKWQDRLGLPKLLPSIDEENAALADAADSTLDSPAMKRRHERLMAEKQARQNAERTAKVQQEVDKRLVEGREKLAQNLGAFFEDVLQGASSPLRSLTSRTTFQSVSEARAAGDIVSLQRKMVDHLKAIRETMSAGLKLAPETM